MKNITILFPHQLFMDNPAISGSDEIYLVEEFLFFNQYSFHKQKIAFHRAAMKCYRNYLEGKGISVIYIDAQDKRADVRVLIESLKGLAAQVHYIDPVDDWLSQRMNEAFNRSKLESKQYHSPLFLNRIEDIKEFFTSDKNYFFQTEFYIAQRKKRNILTDKGGSPLGGKWSFDHENRKKYPKDKKPPHIDFPVPDKYWKEAEEYVDRNFSKNPGLLNRIYFPTDFPSAEKWLDQFLETRFAEFGDYEDAMVEGESILNHSVLTPMLNTGLLTPGRVLEKALKYASEQNIPLNSVEGFVRQILGWREFIRGVYCFAGRKERTRNFWKFKRKLPASFYNGNTGITPVDDVIRKVLKTGYCHHIERLMVLGNFMLLCEFDPDEVYRWFMELFIDAYDWVMVPNVYGMSQFADGGILATKPYISGSNYLRKMGNYPKGPWQTIWDGLFWRFMQVHRDFFSQNPRLSMLLGTFDKMDSDKRVKHLKVAEDYLAKL